MAGQSRADTSVTITKVEAVYADWEWTNASM
jgi:hypothetical protein